MKISQLIILGLLELVSVVLIVRLWLKRRHKNIAVRIFWSVVLLVPLFGPLFYGFICTDPDEHPYDTDTTSGSAMSQAGEGEGHHH
jgi:hypothetical protein